MSYVEDDFAGPLATRLRGLASRMTSTYGTAVANGAEEFLPEIRSRLKDSGAPLDIHGTVSTFGQGLNRAVGIPASHPAAQAAFDFEYGSADFGVAPSGVYRLSERDLSNTVGAHLARAIEGAL